MNKGYQDCISSIIKLGDTEFFNYKGSMVNKKALESLLETPMRSIEAIAVARLAMSISQCWHKRSMQSMQSSNTPEEIRKHKVLAQSQSDNGFIHLQAAAERCLVLLGLTEQSALLLTTQDVALLFGLSYDYTYKHIVSHPDFPRPVRRIDGKIRKREERRWIAGDIIRDLCKNSLLTKFDA